ncbi:unnamed protein product, partial [Ascophyllum nodosum]
DHATQIAVSKSGFLFFTRPSVAKLNKASWAPGTRKMSAVPLREKPGHDECGSERKVRGSSRGVELIGDYYLAAEK